MILVSGSFFSSNKIKKKREFGALELYTFSLKYLGYWEGRIA